MLSAEGYNSVLVGPQVVHWDRQSAGVHHDRADRLVDLYASGEQRSYGPLFLQRKMNISNQAFSEGDFSLAISDLQVGERRGTENTTGAWLKKYTALARATLLTGGLPYSKYVSSCTLDTVFQGVFGRVWACLQCFQNTWKFH